MEHTRLAHYESMTYMPEIAEIVQKIQKFLD